MSKLALKHAIGLSLLFLVVYGGTNWLSAQRGITTTWYYDWELAIPFVPLMILPYLSIDLFFVAAPFLCRQPTELRVLSRRITLAVLVAGACFLLMPLRVAFVKPELTGWLGQAFQLFLGLDQPYNLLPSLHITLRTILAEHYGRHSRGVWRWGLHLWFSLIGVSTILTYQHQVVDVIGGFILAGLCFYTVRAPAAAPPVTPNRRLAGTYGGGALACLALGALTLPWGAWLAWPALAIGLAAGAYLGWGPGIFRKTAGQLPLSSRLVLAPLLLGQWLSLRWYARQCRPWDQAAPGVFIGRVLNEREAAEAIRQGVTAVLDLTAEFSETPRFRALRYHGLPILDLTAPTPAQVAEGVAFIRAEVARGGTVFVHCKIGYSRSAVMVAGWLLASGQAATAEAAVAMLRKVRPSIVIRPEALASLQAVAGECAV